ncbi:MAG: hypothetical protein E2P02_19990 [Acidobacteria bacterium]|nr:MAG: hypothetical protein E2P02_19990 [Acidobacteriota bacterium]
MVFFNYTTMQVSAKIVYYGPGLCGKTTNLHQIHKRTDPDSRGEMVSLETEADRTLFFDLLPLEVGTIGGMRVRLQLYTVPGQVFYNTTRKLVLKGVDGIVFVADSQEVALDANIESFLNLKENLEELNQPLDKIPFVFQYNKRDLRNILPVEAMDRHLNHDGYDVLEGAALHSVGVFETLKTISKKTLAAVHRKISGTREKPVLVGASGRGPAAAVEKTPVEADLSPPELPTDKTLVGAHVPLPVIDVDARDHEATSASARAELVDVDLEATKTVEIKSLRAASRPPGVDTSEVQIEFAANRAERERIDTSRTVSGLAPLRVPTQSKIDIDRELSNLREMAFGTAKARKKKGPKQGKEVLVEGTAVVEVPTKVLEKTSGVVVDLKLVGDDTHHSISKAIRVELPPREEGTKTRLRLQIDLTEPDD